MTRGRILYIYNSFQVCTTCEFNGDMYPQRYGEDVVAGFKNGLFENYGGYERFVENFNRKYFRYDDELIKEFIGCTEQTFDITDNWTDYLYLINESSDEWRIKTKENKENLPAHSLAIIHYQTINKIVIREFEIIEINETMLQSKIYFVRNQKVMLDFELAEIYGYTTKRFNEQIKNNIERFDEDFRFKLTREEVNNLRSKNSTSSWGGSRYLPYAFTEQGIYMLMTVLKGELAVKQSKALIRTFKRMKDYIIENQDLIGEREYLQLSMQISQNIHTTMELRSNLNEVEDQMANVMDRLSDVVTHSELSEVMNEFGEPHIKRGYLVLNGEPFKADIIFDEIYSSAKKSIFIVDNYIGLKTLEKLINIQNGVDVFIFSDNIAKGLRKNTYIDFCKEYPSLHIQLFYSGGIFHDRYIILDYGTDDEKVFLCGASSKDAGGRITSILEDPDRMKYDSMIKDLFKNNQLVLK